MKGRPLNRKLISLLMAFSFLAIAITGVVMYFRPFQTSIAAIHTLFAGIFLAGALVHIWNNLRPLKMYASSQNKKLKVAPPSLLMGIGLGVVAFFTYSQTSVFYEVYDWGNKYRSRQLGKEVVAKSVEHIELTKREGDFNISIEGKIGRAFKYPMFAAWLEDGQDRYLKTIYVSESIGTSTFDYKKGVKGKHIIRRPSALPVWGHRRGIPASDGLMIPLGRAADLDGYTGATPLSDFEIDTRTSVLADSVLNIYFEVNQSYDWNDYYSKDRFPEDSIYTLSGQSGQPSLIYHAQVLLSEVQGKRSYIMNPVGHSHHSGQNGTLYRDLTHMTTSQAILDRVIINIEKL